MKRRELFRRSILGAIGSIVAAFSGSRSASAAEAEWREFPPGYDASKELARPDWAPAFLSAHQDRTLTVLSELIIPETETPGAKAALVNRFIDKVLAAEKRETQQAFLNSLAFLDGESRKRHGSAFVHLPKESQLSFVRFLAYPHRLVTWPGNRSHFSGHEHFQNLKGWITRAYYSSEIGMRELGWDGHAIHGPFVGCPHPEETHQ
ncbi:MAG: gluconate 2-dehydrogenase subunit 3 family protein [Acidobacteriota bacterium]